MGQQTIVLAHGILGFGALPQVPSLVNYFNGVAAHLRRQGHTVIAPPVNPVGSVQLRGEQLAAMIREGLPDAEGIHIIAHSMGGLDARSALASDDDLAGRVATLVTIGTPHRGSPVADALSDPTNPLREHIPEPFLSFLQRHAGALQDLTTRRAVRFDEETKDVAGVRYVEVAGDASLGGHELLLFRLAAAIGQITGEVNDGVVTRASALRRDREHLDDWPVDHAGEIGWTLPLLPAEVELPLVPPPPHFARYDAIVGTL